MYSANINYISLLSHYDILIYLLRGATGQETFDVEPIKGGGCTFYTQIKTSCTLALYRCVVGGGVAYTGGSVDKRLIGELMSPPLHV